MLRARIVLTCVVGGLAPPAGFCGLVRYTCGAVIARALNHGTFLTGMLRLRCAQRGRTPCVYLLSCLLFVSGLAAATTNHSLKAHVCEQQTILWKPTCVEQCTREAKRVPEADFGVTIGHCNFAQVILGEWNWWPTNMGPTNPHLVYESS